MGNTHANPATSVAFSIRPHRHRGRATYDERCKPGEHTGPTPAPDTVVEILERPTRNCFSKSNGAVATLMLFIIAVIQAVILATTDVSTGKAADAAVKSAATAEEAINQMDIAQRPWVHLSKAAPVHLSVMDTGVIVSLELKAKNIGHSPAEGVYAIGKVFPDFSLDKQAPAARTVCEDASNHLEFQQIMIFPDDERHLLDSQFTINMQEIIDRRMEQIVFQYNESTPYIGKQKAEAKRQEELANPIFDTFTVVGCLVYSYRSGRAYGKTAFVLDIHKPCQESPVVPVGTCTFNVSHPAEYRADEMEVTESDRALFAR